jgi:hypothetical protein
LVELVPVRDAAEGLDGEGGRVGAWPWRLLTRLVYERCGSGRASLYRKLRPQDEDELRVERKGWREPLINGECQLPKIFFLFVIPWSRITPPVFIS